MNNNLEINEFSPLREVVFVTLRRQILRGELKPGERLMEISLANKLGVSRTPIREAIRMLEHEGLAVMKPRRGAQVAKISAQELTDVLEIRESLETLAISKACERMDAEGLLEMDAAARKFEELAAKPGADLTALAEADVAFHDAIYNGTKNLRLIQILGNLREQMFRFRIEYLKDETVRKELVEEHCQIRSAIRARDSALAVAKISEHIDNQRQAIFRSLEN
ncbi:MAG: GntR family transcriptional regulator [Lachnospiraceae bacterium]